MVVPLFAVVITATLLLTLARIQSRLLHEPLTSTTWDSPLHQMVHTNWLLTGVDMGMASSQLGSEGRNCK